MSIASLLHEHHGAHASGTCGALHLGSNSSRKKLERNTTRRVKTFSQQKGICHYCTRRICFSDWTLDHLVPLSRGGSKRMTNIKGCCFACNNEKGAKTEPEYRAFLAGKKIAKNRSVRYSSEAELRNTEALLMVPAFRSL